MARERDEPDATHRPWSNLRRLHKAKTESWYQRTFSPRFFSAGNQNHVGQNLVPENSAATCGIIGQRRRLSAILAGAFAFVGIEIAFLQIFQQPTGNFPPLLR